MALVQLAERAPLRAPSHLHSLEYSITEVSIVLQDLSWTSTDGSTDACQKLENEVMVDPWSSMDSSNSPSASDDCTPSTSSDHPRGSQNVSSPLSPDVRRLPHGFKDTRNIPVKSTDKARSRDLRLDLDSLEHRPRRPHFLDEDFNSPSKSNLECRIPKPHFLDSPSPDELEERSDITNPNFLDDEIDGDDNAQKKAGALPKKPPKAPSYPVQEERPYRTEYRSALQYRLENAARSSERDKRASQLYTGTWPGDREVWTSHDTSSVRSFSSNGSADGNRSSSNLENKMECVCSLISLLTLSPENNADLSGPLLEMSRSVESCIAMRQAGCIPLLVQLIHSKVPRETRDRAAKALRNIIHTQTDDKAGRREARVWRLLEQVRDYCYFLEDVVEARKEGKEIAEDDVSKHPSQSVAALMKLSFDEEHRHVVCQFGGLQALAALVSGDQAAHGSRTDDNTCLTMRKYAGMTLTNLTFGDGNNKSLLCSFKEFMLALVEQLESPNDDMRQVTAAVLRNLSWRADTNSKQVLREVGAVKGLTKAAMTCQKEATLKSVLSALWNLTAHCSMNKVALCSVDGALGFLVEMLSYDSPTKTLAIVENAGGIMRNVSSHIAVREDYRLILRERNCLSVLLQHLKSPSLTVVSNSCGTLWNLSARCPQDQQFLWDQGAVPMLRSLIHSKHKMIAMGSGAALKNLLNSKPGKSHIIALDTTARNMNLPALPTLGVRKQKALEQELDQNLAETCDNIEPATSPSTSNREEKNLFTATERHLAMNLERHRMTSSSPLMGALSSQISLSHSAHLASYLSCSNTLLKGSLVTRSSGSANNVNRSDSKDSVTSTHSDSIFERVTRTGKVPVPTPRNKDLMKIEPISEAIKLSEKPPLLRYPSQPPIPPPRRDITDIRPSYTESSYDVDQDSCDQPVDYSQKYSESKSSDSIPPVAKSKNSKKYVKKENTFGDYQETDLDQPTDYSLRYAEHHSENGSDTSEPPGPSLNEDTIKHFATEGTPYETPIIFSTATSMSDLRVIGKDGKPKTPNIKENPEVMTHSDEKDTCSIEDGLHDNDLAISDAGTITSPSEKRGLYDTKFSSGMGSPEKPVNYCDEGTPGYFSRVSSLSSLEANEEGLAKKNAMATINVEPSQEQSTCSSKDREGSKAVTFTEPVSTSASTPALGSVRGSPKFIEDTPLMFSRSSSLGSLPDCDNNEDQGSVVSEVSRLTSGCISPSEIPDSPGQSVPLSPRRTNVPTEPTSPRQEENHVPSVFEERTSRFVVENTPALLSGATSLSSLTIDDEPKQRLRVTSKTAHDNAHLETISQENDNMCTQHLPSMNQNESEPPKGTQTPGDTTRVYFTEDTPAVLSKAGSNSNLSALSILSAISDVEDENLDKRYRDEKQRDSSDSSNLSDSGDLLQECIQKGIAKVVKNKGPTVEVPINPFARDDVYRSLPPYLRSSTETVKMSHEYRKQLDIGNSSNVPPPRPPRNVASTSIGTNHESRLPIKSHRSKDTDLVRNDSLSSLSLDSFGSTDREIFEETVQAGLNPHRSTKNKAHSVERPVENAKHTRHHKSLDRSEKTRKDENRQGKGKRRDDAFTLTRFSQDIHGKKHTNDGPASLPSRMNERKLDRSSSLSSLSNDSFGSTDKEVFERCVNLGMTRDRAKSDDRLDSTVTHKDSRGKSDDRLDSRRRRRERGTLDKMAGDDAALLEEVIARGARQTKNSAGGGDSAGPAPRAAPDPPPAGSDCTHSHTLHTPANNPASAAGSNLTHASAAGSGQTHASIDTPPAAGVDHIHLPTHVCNDPSSPLAADCTHASSDRPPRMYESHGSNECLASADLNTTFQSDATFTSDLKDDLDRSNESYADNDIDNDQPKWTDVQNDASKKSLNISNESCADRLSDPRAGLQWVDINYERPSEDTSKKSTDTWNDNTCPDDVTFPTMTISNRSDFEAAGTLPDLLEASEAQVCCQPDLTDSLNRFHDEHMLDNIPEPSYHSLIDDHKLDSLMASAIEKEAARLAAQLKSSQYAMEHSVTSLTSLDLDNVKPPSHLGSLLSLSASGQWDESSMLTSKKSKRKKSLPVSLMVKRALSNSMHRGSSEHLDSNPASFLDNIKPPSEMENVDMDSSMISVSSIVSEEAETRKTPITFDFKQPITDFPLYTTFTSIYHDLDKVNPPSLFDEIAESTLDLDTVQPVADDNTLMVVTDIPSGSETCTPLPSDISSVESTPKKQRDPNYLTPKEKRYVAKDRYQTYTITEPPVTEDEVVLQVETQDFMTWTKSESDRSDEYTTTESRSKRKLSAKQRRIEDRARYQTQTVDIQNIIQTTQSDPQIESLKRRLAEKKTMKQKRIDDAERYRTRTLSEDIPPSPTFVRESFDVETTTGYDSLSSNELNHQQLSDDRQLDDVFSNNADSGHNEDDFELNSTQMQTYTKSFRNYLPVIESPAAVDMCVVNNLKNMEMTASFKCTTSHDKTQNPSSDFASCECESDRHSETESESSKPTPKIIKPEVRRQQSLDSNDSREMDDAPKAIRGRKKAYVSPYRRNAPSTSKPITPLTKQTTKSTINKTVQRPMTSKTPMRTPIAAKSLSANTSPKKTIPNKLPNKPTQSKALSLPLASTSKKLLPLERQGTFVKEESSVPAKDLPVPDKPNVSKPKKATTPTKPNSSPSRLPQFNRSRPTTSHPKTAAKTTAKRPEPKMKNSASSHSLQSNDSGRTVTLTSRSSRQGSTSSVNSISKPQTKDVESRIANLWKKVEQTKKQATKPDKRVWIEGENPETPKLIRSSTFEGQPKLQEPSTAPKQKTAIGIRVSQIPSLRPKSVPSKVGGPTSAKKSTNTKVFTRKQVNGQITS